MGTQILDIYAIEDQRHFLHQQLDVCQMIQGKMRIFVEETLVGMDVYDLEDITDDTKMAYRYQVYRSLKLSEKQKSHYANALEIFLLYYYLPRYPILSQEIYDEMSFERAIANKLASYLMQHGIKEALEITYSVRLQYAEYLNKTIASSKVNEYVKALDQLKLESIKRNNQKDLIREHRLVYANDLIFLLYHPDYSIAKSFYYIRDKEELLFDFSFSVSQTLKRQMFKMLGHILETCQNTHERRERYLLPLKRFYLFCVTEEIVDVEQLEAWQIQKYYQSIKGQVGTKEDVYMQIIDHIRKYLFCSTTQINWDANVWYVERFHLSFDRMNPARPVRKFCFDMLPAGVNQEAFKLYMKYLIGLTHGAMLCIRSQYYILLDFLQFIEKNSVNIDQLQKEHMESYFWHLEEKEILPESFNGYVVTIAGFFRYLVIKKRLNHMPIHMEYYIKQTYQLHHDRSVSTENQLSILKCLHMMPLHLRLMYLNLWCVGLRVNEVCCLRADAYEWDGENAWLRVNQNKMKAEKRVPIPQMLYKCMDRYIRQMKRTPGEYIFQNRKGGAYNAATFCKQMQKELLKAGIPESQYTFRSHDFRHTVSTIFYMHGVSLPVIRDYLGHKTEEMTKMYVDWIPNIIKEGNEFYFKKTGNDLSDHIKMRCENEN